MNRGDDRLIRNTAHLRLLAVTVGSVILTTQCGQKRTIRLGAHTWRPLEGGHWQIEGQPVEPTTVTDAREGTRGACGEGMVQVHGAMAISPGASVEALQSETCTAWLDQREPGRCATFDREAWLRTRAKLESRPMAFCIDRFEYPNLSGAYPVVEVSWQDAVGLCAARDARLCTEDEWTFACEGEEASPYPNGYVRDESGCLMDRPHRDVHEDILARRNSPEALEEIERLWQGEASFSRPKCRSVFGVYDLTGNVDEWTQSSRKGDRGSVLKGGYWGEVRARCRPSTRAHGEDYSYYQSGLRCCRDLTP